MANFFGWCASSVFSVPLTSVQRGPDERGHPTIEFGTSVFKASPLYPVGRLVLQKLPGLFKVVLTFVVACKGQREREFLFGPLASAGGQAAAWLTGCVRSVDSPPTFRDYVASWIVYTLAGICFVIGICIIYTADDVY